VNENDEENFPEPANFAASLRDIRHHIDFGEHAAAANSLPRDPTNGREKSRPFQSR
jgi:hypothetical protein